MVIPFVDLTAQYNSIKRDINRAIQCVVNDTAFIKGKYVREFEINFASYCKAKHCIGVGNGTDALYIALKILGIGPNDEVIVPANSFIASSEAVTMAGADVVFVDCDPQTFNMDPSLIPLKITRKTKAIIPVHLYGQPADMSAIRAAVRKYNIKIIQDCAQAHGATIGGIPLSSFGDLLCYSFYPGKNLGAYGDAGAIVTNDDALAIKALKFANHGRISKYDHEVEGINSRMDGIQGAVLNVKLKHIEEWNRKRIENANYYSLLLSNSSDIITPKSFPGMAHVYHLYVIRSRLRDALKKYLSEKNISTGIHYPVALPNLAAYRHLSYSKSDFPVSSSYQDQILSLPMYPELSRNMMEYIVEKIGEFIKKKGVPIYRE